jgi:hypothetical protein
MIHVSELDRKEPIYVWVADDGTNVRIASVRLRNWVLLNQHLFEIFLVPVDPDMAKDWIRNKQCDPKRVMNLTYKERREPIIYCKRPTFTNGRPDVFLVDGHHRYVRAAVDGDPFIECWLIEIPQWEPFKVIGAIDISQQQLAEAPLANFGSRKEPQNGS